MLGLDDPQFVYIFVITYWRAEVASDNSASTDPEMQWANQNNIHTQNIITKPTYLLRCTNLHVSNFYLIQRIHDNTKLGW